MSEVCPLTELPQVEYVYISADKDDALRPEWEQWQAREILHVEPVVIKDAGHADVILDHVREIVDAATRGLGPAGAAAPVAETSAEPMRAPPQPVTRAGIVGFAIANVAPLAIYFGAHASGANDTQALAFAWILPVAWTIGSSWRRKSVDVRGLLGVGVYGVALFLSLVLGAGALPLKLHKAAVSGLIGLVCLVSAALRRPILVVLARRVYAGSRRSASIEKALARPWTQRRLLRLTLVIGVFGLANAALQLVLALSLSTGAFLATSAAIDLGLVACLIAGLVGWLLWTGRA